MKRCKECACEVYGNDTVCSKCLTNEWRDMHNNYRTRAAINDFNEACNRRSRLRNSIHNGVICAILVLLGLAIVANIPNALNYESKKLQRVLILTGK